MRASPRLVVLTLLSCVLAAPATAQQASAGVDAACAAKCQQVYDRDMRAADAKLSGKDYYVAMGSGDCPAPWKTPNTANACLVTFLDCDGNCGSFECKAKCRAALQPCCYANDIGNRAHDRDVCLAACPKGPTAPTASTAPKRMLTPAELEPRSDTRDVGMSPEDYDNWRRTRALDEVQGKLSEMKGAFAVVSGGQGHLWVVKANGERLRLADDLAGWLRLIERGFKTPNEELAYGSAQDKAYERLRAMGFAADDAVHIAESIALGGGFPAGKAMYFPPNGQWPAEMLRYRVSSEHSSVRGTINGGGDFI